MQKLAAFGYRVVAAAHVLIGAAVALFAAGLMRFTLAHSGSSWPIALLVMGPLVAVGVAIGVWFVVLGVRVGLRSPGWASALRRTHVPTLALSAVVLVAGVLAVRNTQHDPSRGGGLWHAARSCHIDGISGGVY